ncbi:pyridoxal-phosphate dependent enzyme [Marssonina coronariae]|uniref:Pyridoxal-phosphate dependent enzyme n=1 Tax=Diplocarpon coronariae TaxID=2795749 RepID=A0A218ZFK3_9HELO|nr:pyridoxal-phosphate dependent enzyme [Marssonina coronariae]
MADPTKSPPLIRSSVMAAQALIKEHVHYTPVLTNTTLDDLASKPQSTCTLAGTPWAGQEPSSPKLRFFFKCENLQRIGAFKIRGAFHALKRLVSEEGWEEGGGRARGVVTHSSGRCLSFHPLNGSSYHVPAGDGKFSMRQCRPVARMSGILEGLLESPQANWARWALESAQSSAGVCNHAQALALAARTMGIPAHIVMPEISTPNKIAGTRGYGANVIFSGSTSTEREAVVEDVIRRTGARLVPPYDHPDIMLGQGTLGIELQEQAAALIASRGGKASKGLDAMVVPCGGGGMLSGTAISCEGTGIFVFGAEPEFEGGDDCKRGLEQGRRIETVKSLTIADGLRTPVGAYPWTVIHDRRLVRRMFGVTEEQILKAMRLVLERMKIVVEPSAVVGLATALYNEDFRRIAAKEGGAEGWDVGIVISGGNTSVEAIGQMFAVGEVDAGRHEGVGGLDARKGVENVAG